MISVTFEREDEAIIMHNLLKHFRRRTRVNRLCTINRINTKIFIHINEHRETTMKNIIVPAFTTYVIQEKEEKFVSYLLEDLSLYSTWEEQQRLFATIYSVIKCDEKERSLYKNSRWQLVNEAVQDFLQEDLAFSFDAFRTFRLKEYYQRIYHYIQLGVEEHEKEEDYQVFIHELRDIIQKKKTWFQHISIVYNGEFRFYEEPFLEITKESVEKARKEFLTEYPSLRVNERIIAPLLKWAPRKIHLYTDKWDHVLISTIQTIFEERVCLLPLQKFPPPSQSKG